MGHLLGVKGNPLFTKEDYEIALSHGIKPRTVRYRYQKGYSKQQAITEPVYRRLPKRK